MRLSLENGNLHYELRAFPTKFRIAVVRHRLAVGNGRKIGVDDPRLEDRVADNTAKYDITESESLVFGTGFGVGTDIQTGPNGNLYVVSLTHGTVYEIFRRSPPRPGQGGRGQTAN